MEERVRSDPGASLDYDYTTFESLWLSVLQALERRADKQIARQEDALVRAVFRVWNAHERGHLLERLQNARVLRRAWEAWKRRLRHQGDFEGSLPFYLSFHSLVLFSLLHAISCRARVFPAFPSPCHFVRTAGLAKAPRHATNGVHFCSAIRQCTAGVPGPFQVACTVTRAFEAFPSGQDRR